MEKKNFFRQIVKAFIKHRARATALVVAIVFFFNTIYLDVALAAKTDAGLASVSTPSASTSKTSQPYKDLNIKDFILPDYLGTIKDRYISPSASGDVMIHIQDAHCNQPCQNKIADIISYLNSEYGIKVINLEGGSGEYDTAVFTRIGDMNIRQKVAETFVGEGMLNGGEYYAVLNPEKASLWGLEDASLYVKNLDVYRDSLKHKDEVDKYLKSLNHALSSLKAKMYSKDLLELDLKTSAYKSDNIDMRAYLAYLCDAAVRKGMGIDKFADIASLKKAIDLEKSIDFRTADVEREELFKALSKRLSKNAMEEFAAKAIEFKAERISPEVFYGYMLSRARSSGLKTDKYPELAKYLAYVSSYASIDKIKLTKEIESLENALKESYFENEGQRELASLSKNLIILANIFNLKLSKDDYDYYLANEGNFETALYAKFIQKNASIYKIADRLDNGVSDLDTYRKEISKFYEYSLKRDDAFMRNMKFGGGPGSRGQGPDSEVRGAVIVTGGFHSENLCELFKKSGISYISIMPSFKIEEGYACPYFKLLAGQTDGMQNRLYSIISSETRTSGMQIASMLSSAIAEAVWGKARVNAFRAAVEIDTMVTEGKRVLVVNDKGEVLKDARGEELVFGEGEDKPIRIAELLGIPSAEAPDVYAVPVQAVAPQKAAPAITPAPAAPVIRPLGGAVTGWLKRLTPGMPEWARALIAAPIVEEGLYRGFPLLASMATVLIAGAGFNWQLIMIGSVFFQIPAGLKFIADHYPKGRAPPSVIIKMLLAPSIVAIINAVILPLVFTNPFMFTGAAILSHLTINLAVMIANAIFPSVNIGFAAIGVSSGRPGPATSNIETLKRMMRDHASALERSAWDRSGRLGRYMLLMRELLDKGVFRVDFRPENAILTDNAMSAQTFDYDKLYEATNVSWDETKYFIFASVIQPARYVFRELARDASGKERADWFSEYFNDYLDAMFQAGVAKNIIGARSSRQRARIVGLVDAYNKNREDVSILQKQIATLKGKLKELESASRSPQTDAVKRSIEENISRIGSEYEKRSSVMRFISDDIETFLKESFQKVPMARLDQAEREWVYSHPRLAMLKRLGMNDEYDALVRQRRVIFSIVGQKGLAASEVRTRQGVADKNITRPVDIDSGLQQLLRAGVGKFAQGGINGVYERRQFISDLNAMIVSMRQGMSFAQSFENAMKEKDANYKLASSYRDILTMLKGPEGAGIETAATAFMKRLASRDAAAWSQVNMVMPEGYVFKMPLGKDLTFLEFKDIGKMPARQLAGKVFKVDSATSALSAVDMEGETGRLFLFALSRRHAGELIRIVNSTVDLPTGERAAISTIIFQDREQIAITRDALGLFTRELGGIQRQAEFLSMAAKDVPGLINPTTYFEINGKVFGSASKKFDAAQEVRKEIDKDIGRENVIREGMEKIDVKIKLSSAPFGAFTPYRIFDSSGNGISVKRYQNGVITIGARRNVDGKVMAVGVDETMSAEDLADENRLYGLIESLNRRAPGVDSDAMIRKVFTGMGILLPGVGEPALMHAGFGIAMSGYAFASVEDVEAHRVALQGEIDKGITPSSFVKDKVIIGGKEIQIVIHKTVLDRLDAVKKTLQGFIEECIKIRGPDYEATLRTKLAGKPLIFDALTRSPNLYGNCQNDGYIYINTNSPIQLDAVGVSHEFMHEADIFTDSETDEQALAKKDVELMQYVGIDIAKFMERLKDVTMPTGYLAAALAAIASARPVGTAAPMRLEGENLIASCDRSNACDLPNRHRYVEDLVKKLREGKRVEVVSLNIQNFKMEFNDRGNSLGPEVGHLFGDFGIQAVADALPKAIKATLEEKGIKGNFAVYNDGKSYFVIFEDMPAGFSATDALESMLKDDNTAFKRSVVKSVISETKKVKKWNDEATADFTKNFTTRNFNMYAGISAPASLKDEVGSGVDILKLAQRAVAQADLSAKAAQMRTGEILNAIFQQSDMEGKTEADIRKLIMDRAQSARTMAISAWRPYGAHVEDEIVALAKYSPKGEYEVIYRPIPEVYNEEATYENLINQYRVALKARDPAKVLKAKEKLYDKMLFYVPEPSVRSRYVRPIIVGMERFRDAINGLIRAPPQADWSGTFRVGGDEFAKIIFNAKTGVLRILRFDANNLGKMNAAWGSRIGDRVIDDMLRLIDKVQDPNDLMEYIYRYFDNTNERGENFRDNPLELTDTDHAYILRELVRLDIKDTSRYLISDESGRNYLVKVPPLSLTHQETGRSYKTGPSVSVGLVEIDTHLIPGKDRMRDFSPIQGRADSTAETVKSSIKRYQSEHDGAIDFAEVNRLMVNSQPFNTKALTTFERSPIDPLREEFARFIVSKLEKPAAPVTPEMAPVVPAAPALDFNVRIEAVSFKGVEAESWNKYKELLDMAQEIVSSIPRSELLTIIRNISGNKTLRFEDISKDIAISYFAEGVHKYVFRVAFSTKEGKPLEILLAAKKEKNLKDISGHELQNLKKLHGRGVPKFGGSFRSKDGRLWYLEEFIAGDTVGALQKQGALKDNVKRGIVATMLLIATGLNGMIPRDMHAENIMVEKGTGRVVMVDLGDRRLHITGKDATDAHRMLFIGMLLSQYGVNDKERPELDHVFFDAIANDRSLSEEGSLEMLQKAYAELEKRGQAGVVGYLAKEGRNMFVSVGAQNRDAARMDDFVGTFTRSLGSYLAKSGQLRGPPIMPISTAPVAAAVPGIVSLTDNIAEDMALRNVIALASFSHASNRLTEIMGMVQIVMTLTSDMIEILKKENASDAMLNEMRDIRRGMVDDGISKIIELHKKAIEQMRSGGKKYAPAEVSSWKEEYLKAYRSFEASAKRFDGVKEKMAAAVTDKELPKLLKWYGDVAPKLDDVLSDRASLMTGELKDELIDLREVLDRELFIKLLQAVVNNPATERYFDIRMPDGPVMVKGNRISLSALFTDLANNAYKYAEKAQKGNAKVIIELALENGKPVVKVTDNGEGITPEKLAQMQQPFFTTGGTGIGLTESRIIAKDHGGSIDVQSEPGKGAMFIVRLPLASAPVSIPPVVEVAGLVAPAPGEREVVKVEKVTTPLTKVEEASRRRAKKAGLEIAVYRKNVVPMAEEFARSKDIETLRRERDILQQKFERGETLPIYQDEAYELAIEMLEGAAPAITPSQVIKTALADAAQGTANIIVMAGSEMYVAQQTSINRTMAQQLGKTQNITVVPYSYKYGENIDWKAGITKVLSMAVQDLHARIKKGDATARVIVFVPFDGVKDVKAMVAGIDADMVPRVTVVGEANMPMDGGIDNIVHIASGVSMLEYERFRKGDYGDAVMPQESKMRLNDLMKLLVVDPAAIDIGKHPDIIDRILDGLTAIPLRPITGEISQRIESMKKVLQSL